LSEILITIWRATIHTQYPYPVFIVVNCVYDTPVLKANTTDFYRGIKVKPLGLQRTTGTWTRHAAETLNLSEDALPDITR